MSSPPHDNEKTSSSASVSPGQAGPAQQLRRSSTRTDTPAPETNQRASARSSGAGNGFPNSSIQVAATSALIASKAEDLVSGLAQSQAVPKAPGAQASSSQPASFTNSPPPGPRRTQSDNAHHADPLFSRDKRQRPAALAQRQSGSSLITQALATVRGIPQSQQQQDSLTSPTLTVSSRDASAKVPLHAQHPGGTSIKSQASYGASQATQLYDATDSDDDGGSLTPRASPRSSPAAMAAPASPTASTSIISQTNILQPPSTYDAVGSTPMGLVHHDHGALVGCALRRGNSLERFASNFVESGAAGRLSVGRDLSGWSEANLGEDRGSSTRPKPPEHRFSVGPEKMWSIGMENVIGDQGEGGQVEKSIKEAMGKPEHAARSRKTSHKLGFFKEGNPYESNKRKDTKRTISARENSSVSLEHLMETSRGTSKPTAKEALDSDEAQPDAIGGGDLTPTLQRSSTFQSPPLPSESPLIAASQDAGGHSHGDDASREDKPRREILMAERQVAHVGPTLLSSSPDRIAGEGAGQLRRPSDGSTEIGDGVEDGDDSGEEKISSALFLPHQGLEESGVRSDGDEATAAGPSSAARTLSRGQDDYLWLVKAGQPEEGQTSPSAGATSPRLEDAPRLGDEFAIVDEPESVLPSAEPSRSVSYFDDPRHEHQLNAKQPLPAIELIPYRHQVGGHTTLWRFSKRAVCKQLNNRENEFYETVERFHRDLLPFLPRYVLSTYLTRHARAALLNRVSF